MIQPPRVGPRIGATMTPIENVAIATPRRAGGKLSIRMAWAIGCRAPPPTPCRTRATMSMPRLVAAPHTADEIVKSAMQVSRKRFRPNAELSHAVVGRMIALDTR